MAPVPEPTILTYLSSLLRRTPIPSPTVPSLLSRAAALLPRDSPLKNPASGVTPPSNIANKAVFALFGLIGVGFVLTGIWFFFWAKNGGFYFKENDWDDYKSTVLRRKGPNGTTLSGATESTDLGGGSVVHGQRKWGRQKRYKDFDEEATEYTGSGGGSTLGSEMSEMKKPAKKEKKRKEKKVKKAESTALTSEVASTAGDPEEELDVGVRNTIREYRHEKPARVGGLNKASDASAFDGSTNDGSTAASELLSHREQTPTNTPTKVRKERKDNYTGGTGGIRKVVSTSEGSHFWSRNDNAGSPSAKKPLIEDTDDHIKAEARRLQEKGRAAKRDFSFQAGDDSTIADSERSARREEREERRRKRREEREKTAIPGSFYEESEVGSNVSSDVGTKSYHHPIPGLSSTAGSEYADERRKKRNGGYRREG